jgi:glycosyltransferase involved in cell wall biosynthesis
MSEVDHVVAVCDWVAQLLLRNDVEPEKITLSRQGLPYAPAQTASAPERKDNTLRLAFLGRLSPMKGLDTVVDAIVSRPALRVRLDVYGVLQEKVGTHIKGLGREKCATDERIRFLDPIPAEEAAVRLGEYDALVVPSRWLETGPLVIYEAFAAGIPVIGSNRGGIAELVRDWENGLLVQAGSVEDWAMAIECLASKPGLLARLKAGVRQPRTMQDVAQDMDRIYSAAMRQYVCH